MRPPLYGNRATGGARATLTVSPVAQWIAERFLNLLSTLRLELSSLSPRSWRHDDPPK